MMKKLYAAFAGLAMLAGTAQAEDTIVKMVNFDPETKQTMAFQPSFVTIEVGDTVTWKPTAPGHNVEFIIESAPDGVEAFSSKINQEVSYTFDKPGIYLYKCTPHFAAGMIGIIKVGETTDDLAGLKTIKLSPMATKRLDKIITDAAK